MVVSSCDNSVVPAWPVNDNPGYASSSVMSGCEVRRACDTNDGCRKFRTSRDIITEEILFPW